MNHFYKIYLKARSDSGVKLNNELKFIKVVEFWFDYLSFTLDIAINKKKEIALLNTPIIKKSILHAFDILEKNNCLFRPTENNIKRTIIGSFFLGKIGYLPGGVSQNLFDKLQFKILYNKLYSINIQTSSDFKNLFFEECQLHFDTSIVKLLNDIVPEIFFSTGLQTNKRLPSILKGSPLSFLDFNYNYLKLFLQPNYIKLIGIQHGGYYGEWNDNPYDKFESNISDDYYGWGFFKKNIIQNRFKKNVKQYNKREGVYWFGRHTGYVSDNIDFGNDYGKHNQVISHIDFFNTFFMNHNYKFLPHPSLNPVIYKQVIDQSRYVYSSNSTLFVANAKLVVFDCLSHTLMYYCLYNNIPFVIVVDNWPINGLSLSALEFYNELYINELLLSKNDINISDKLINLNNKLMSNHNIILKNSFLNYIEKKFFSHKSIDLI